jgi:hypothetical protein
LTSRGLHHSRDRHSRSVFAATPILTCDLSTVSFSQAYALRFRVASNSASGDQIIGVNYLVNAVADGSQSYFNTTLLARDQAQGLIRAGATFLLPLYIRDAEGLPIRQSMGEDLVVVRVRSNQVGGGGGGGGGR